MRRNGARRCPGRRRVGEAMERIVPVLEPRGVTVRELPAIGAEAAGHERYAHRRSSSATLPTRACRASTATRARRGFTRHVRLLDSRSIPSPDAKRGLRSQRDPRRCALDHAHRARRTAAWRCHRHRGSTATGSSSRSRVDKNAAAWSIVATRAARWASRMGGPAGHGGCVCSGDLSPHVSDTAARR